MSTELIIIRGAHESYPVQLWKRGGEERGAFASSDMFTCTISRGQDQAPLFSAAVTWFTRGGTQTGYEQGQVLVEILAADSATLEPGGTYHGLIWWSQQQAPAADFRLTVKPAPGTATQDITPYCTFADMLLYADWVRHLQRKDTDQEGFYSQRVQARNWMDGLVLSAYSGQGWFPFGDPGASMYTWSGGGMGGGLAGSSSWLRGALGENRLILHPEIVRACAYKAISIVGLSPVGGTNYQQQGQWFASMADYEALTATAEMDTASPPTGTMGVAIPLNTARMIQV